MDAQNSLRISRVLHAGYLFECENTRILFDPIFENPFSVNCYAHPAVQFDFDQIRDLKLDGIFISHFHDDHCSLDSLQHLDKNTPLFLYCEHQELFEILQKFGFTDVHRLTVDRAENVGSFRITPRRALDEHTDTIFEILAAGCKILNVVDAQISSDTLKTLQAKAPWDLVLWPFQLMRESEVLTPTRADVSLNLSDSIDETTQTAESGCAEFPEEWTLQLQTLQPRLVVPSSCQFIHEEWSWYRKHFFRFSYAEFSAYIKNILPKTNIVRLNPGSSLEWNNNEFHPAEPLPWIQPQGPQDVDYTYDPQAPVLSTAEIAQKFPPLTSNQQTRLEKFCRTEILERYQHIGPPEDIYFQKKRLWKLSIFDHEGRASQHFYEICDEHMTAVTKPYVTENVSWATEISAHKLFSALENGESLSSLYLRINAETFKDSIEDELQEVNHLEDPLLRTLYNGEPLSYQKAQLKRWQSR